MADNIGWLSVLQKVFKKYGTQLQAKQVEKFAAKVARKQGRTEEKKELQKACKKFLRTETGRNSVVSNDNLLSLRKSVPAQPGTAAHAPGLAPAQPPAQARLSLFDLAEAAAALSNTSPQSSPAPPKRKSAKARAVANPSAVPVTKGPRSVRNRKPDSSSPDAATDPATAAAATVSAAAPPNGMQTRGLATRRQSIDRPRGGTAALPPRPKPRSIKSPKELPEPSMDDKPPSASAAEQELDTPADKPASFAQGLSVVPSNSDATAPGPTEDVPSTSGPDSQQALAAHRTAKDLPESSRLPIPAASQPTTAALAPALHSEESDSPAPEPVKQQKRSKQLAQEAAAALPVAAGKIKGNSKAAANKARLDAAPTEAIAAAEAPRPSSTEQEGVVEQAAAAASEASEGRRKKHKHKHEAAVTGRQSTSPAGDISGSAADANAAQSQPAAEPVKPASTAVDADAANTDKVKKSKKRKHSQATSEQAAEALPDASDAATTGAEAFLAAAPASTALQDQAKATDSNQAAVNAPQETALKLKKKKKRKHSEGAGPSQQSEAAALTATPAAEAVPAEPVAEMAAAEMAAAAAAAQADPDVKPKKKKKKHKHREVADEGMHNAPSAMEAVPIQGDASAADSAAASPATAAAPSTAQPSSSTAAPEPTAAGKAKKRKSKHGGDPKQQAAGPSRSQPASIARSDTAAALPQSGAAATTGNHQAAQPVAQPKHRRNSVTAAVREAARAVDAAQLPAAQLPASEDGGEATEAPAAELGNAAADEHAGEGAAPRARQIQSAEQASPSGWLPSWRENAKRTDVKKGKFTKAEKDTLKQAAVDYAQSHGLSTTDFAWLFCTRGLNSEYKQQAGGAWRSISASLPHRTNKAVYACGTRMLHERNYQGKWSKEEGEQLRQLVADKGPKWAEISRSLGRLPEGCRDKWRELRLGDAKQNGRWSEDETERLRSLVNEYMNKKQAIEEEQNQGGAALSLTLDDLGSGSADAAQAQSDGRIILDDIDWDLVSEQHGTRSAAQCLTKWYTQLAPSMVTKGEWGSGDDRRLLRALLKSGATEDFHVDWGRLVASRTAQQARRRWRLMLKCVKDAHDREFSENLNQLVTTFVPDLLPAPLQKAVKAKKSKRQKDKEAATAAAAVAAVKYPGMSGGMY